MKTRAAIAQLRTELLSTYEWIGRRSPERLIYRFVSWDESREYDRSLSAWNKAGRKTQQPTPTRREVRAQVYGFGRPVAEARAFRHVFICSCAELSKASLFAIDQCALNVSFTLLRSLMERIAVGRAVSAELTNVLSLEASDKDRQFQNIARAGEVLTSALHGTKVNWTALFKQQVSKISAEQAKYAPLDYGMNLSAKQILNSVDALKSELPGARIAYDVLCEFLHPNTGDMFSSILNAGGTFDSEGMKFLEFTIGRGPIDLRLMPDIDAVLAETVGIVRQLLSKLPEVDASLVDSIAKMDWRSKKLIRPLVTQYADFFRPTHFCPCSSGKVVGECCGIN